MRAPFVAALVLVAAGAGAVGWYLGRQDAPAPAPDPTSATAAAPAAAATPAAARPDPLDWRARIKYEDRLPAFIDPPEGQRAPTHDAFGLAVGAATLDDVKRWTTERGLICKDTSVRALMADYRDQKVAEMEKAKAAGGADGTSGASWLWRASKHERSPNVRFTCEKVRLSAIGDRTRPEESVGRLLLIFDSPDHPLRHVTIQRTYPDDAHAAARADFIAADEAMRARFGEPTITRAEPPAEGAEFPNVTPIRRDWHFADLHAKVSALRLKNGVTVYEEIGVPFPVRPDAPVKPAAAQ
ncbi:MAG: hypothetical protein H6701_13800 [Myxococcales bacterium]|nr:hypothetical protein [Myxococcales bacterium]